MSLPRDDEWPVWTRIDHRVLEHAQGEEPFFETATSLVTEFGQLTVLLVRSADPATELRALVLRGLATRIAKLTRRMIVESFEGRGELQALLDRELFESVADLGYLLRGRDARVRAFVEHSLEADRRVWAHVQRNRELRGGEALPQEERMRARLERSFALAGASPEALADGVAGWPSLEERLAAVGEPDAHPMHELGAGVVHGSWHELISYHLEAAEPGAEEDGLSGRVDWSAARVQPLHAVAIQGGRVMGAYARELSREIAGAFRDKYLDLAHRAADSDRLHEEYLARADAGWGDDFSE